MNNGSNAVIKFYIDYPDDVMSAQVPKAILASLISSELHKLQNLTRLSITLLTEVVPEAPSDPTPEQQNNAVSLRILSFSVTQVLPSSCLHRLVTLTNEFRILTLILLMQFDMNWHYLCSKSLLSFNYIIYISLNMKITFVRIFNTQ